MSTHSVTTQQDRQRQDLIVHRFYIKAVEVLTEARLTHDGFQSERQSGARTEDQKDTSERGKKEVRIDKWFNLPLPDPEFFRPDLITYKSISNSSPASSSNPYASVPPLLIAFILDVSDLPAKHALVHRRGSDGTDREGGKLKDTYRLDLPTDNEPVDHKGKGRQSPGRTRGIVLERWTLRSLQLPSNPSPTTSSTTSPINSMSSSSAFIRTDRPPAQATGATQGNPITYPSSSASYKSGIIHFRSLYQYIRLLPAYRLHRRLRRKTHSGGSGGNLRVGVKLWSAEGYDEDWVRQDDLGMDDDDSDTDDEQGRRAGSPTYRRRTSEEGIREAWNKMEQGLIGLNQSLLPYSTPINARDPAQSEESLDDKPIEYTFPTIPLSHGLFSLSVQARQEVDFWAEDVESILSSALAGVDLRARESISAPHAQSENMGALDLEEEYFTPTLTAKRKASVSVISGLYDEQASGASSRANNTPIDPSDVGETGVAASTALREPANQPTVAVPPLRPRRVISESQVGSGAGVGLDARYRGDGSRGSDAGSNNGTEGGTPALPFAVPKSSTRSGAEGTERIGSVSVSSGPNSLGDRTRLGGLYGRISTSPLASLGIARRNSALSLEIGAGSQPFATPTPSSSLGNRSSPLATGFRQSGSYDGRPSSLQRPSSYLSSSGRSFSQLNEPRSRPSNLANNLTGAGTSPSRASFRGPLSLSPSSSSIPRTNVPTRPGLTGHQSNPTPPIPEYHEEEAGHGVPVPVIPHSLKRYSSSFGQRRPSFNLGLNPGAPSSAASSLDPGSLAGLGMGGHSMSRTTTRLSGSSRPPSFSTAPDNDDINMFLRTLDTMPRPPSLSASVAQSRAYLPSTSSLLSLPRRSSRGSPEPSEPPSGTGSIGIGAGASAFMRRPLTKAQVNDTLNRMAGSYTMAAQPFPQPVSSAGLTGSALATSSSVSPVDRMMPSGMRAAQQRSSLNQTSSLGESRGQPVSPTLHERTSSTSSFPASNKEVAFSLRMGSSVKSSSPLAQAPIQASPTVSAFQGGEPISDKEKEERDREQGEVSLAPVVTTVDQSSPIDLQSRDMQSDLTKGRQIQSLPGSSQSPSLTRNRSLPPPNEPELVIPDDYLPSRPMSIDREKDGKRIRAPVLQRGGFGQLMSPDKEGIRVASPGARESKEIATGNGKGLGSLGRPSPSSSPRGNPMLLSPTGIISPLPTSPNSQGLSYTAISPRRSNNHPHDLMDRTVRATRGMTGIYDHTGMMTGSGNGGRDNRVYPSVHHRTGTETNSSTAPSSLVERDNGGSGGRRWASEDDQPVRERYRSSRGGTMISSAASADEEHDEDEISIVGDLEMAM